MDKYKRWTVEEKIKIVKDFENDEHISYLNNKYGISECGSLVLRIRNIMKENLA